MYQVWVKSQYEEAYRLTECPDLASVEAIIRDNFGKDLDVRISIPVTFDAKIAVKIHAPTGPAGEPNAMAAVETRLKEVIQSEATESEAKPDKSTRAKSHGKI